MPGNFANTYFANQLAFRNAVIRDININIIDPGRIINVNSGASSTYTIDDEYTPIENALYIPSPGILIAANNTEDATTSFVINNPNNFNVEFRVDTWFSSPIANISVNSFPNFDNTTSTVTLSDAVITFRLYANPSNPSEKAWFYVN